MLEEVTTLLNKVLQPHPKQIPVDAGFPLLGSLPELDSMSVVALVNALEDQFGFVIEDGDISGDIFATLRDLVEFVNFKISSIEAIPLAVGD